MAVKLRFGDVDASVANGVWSSADPDLTQILTDLSTLNPAGGEDPWPDLTTAQFVVTSIGGTIVDQGDPPEFDPDVVY